MRLTNSNCSIDESSGAVLIHKPPELSELSKIRDYIDSINKKLDDIDSINKKLDLILDYLKEEVSNG